MTEVLKGKRVSRLDSISLDGTYFTPEGYLIDRPILTSCGIFEYKNPDGTIRRELRLPEHVFDAESLKSYSGKPVIITHEAGIVTKDNVRNEIVGTIMSNGYQDGQNVRAEIVIHDVNAVKTCGMRELSLGYDLELVEQPGVWNGQHYDAIQTNIRINHLAIVKEARAGNQAHLNMDNKDKSVSDDKKYTEGGKKKMSNRTRRDAMLSPEDFAASIKAYKAKKAELAGTTPTAAGETPQVASAEKESPEKEDKKPTVEPSPTEPVAAPESKQPEIPAGTKPEGESTAPKDLNEALELIRTLNATVQKLQETVDRMQAEKDIHDSGEPEDAKEIPQADGENKQEPEAVTPAAGVAPQTEPAAEPDKKEEETPMNMDSIDAIVSQKLELGKVGQKLNLDGLETMDIKEAKQKVILAVKPGMRLDGKSDAYIDAAYEMARDIANERKTTNDQRQQMANGQRLDGMEDEIAGPSCSAYEARQKLINRRENKE